MVNSDGKYTNNIFVSLLQYSNKIVESNSQGVGEMAKALKAKTLTLLVQILVPEGYTSLLKLAT